MGIKSVVKMLFILFAISGLGFSLSMGYVSAAKPLNMVQREEVPLELTVILKRVYLDGEISEEKVIETGQSMEELLNRYEGWAFVQGDSHRIVLKQKVDDISPLLKANGYFGLSEDGVLTIFDGRPIESKIIQSFFQIDVEKLESRTREELLKGIPIKTKDEYEKVIEAFKPYTRHEKLENEQGRKTGPICAFR